MHIGERLPKCAVEELCVCKLPTYNLSSNGGVACLLHYGPRCACMAQDAPGLQFIPADGKEWIDAPVRPGEFVVIVGDVLERLTNGVLKATPHRVKLTDHPRHSIIRFNALHPDTLIEPLPAFVTPDRPAAYTPVTMRVHMETTIRNLEAGLPAWDDEKNVSKTATYVY